MNKEIFLENFELLTDAPNGVQKLRELILQLAIQGKLATQNPYDESASILLEKIKNEKHQFVKEKKKKKSIPLTAVESNEIPYNLPSSWNWVYLDQISNMVHYGYTASANFNLKEVRLLRITDIQNNKVKWDNVPGCEIDGNKLENHKLNDGDLLIARTGGTIGKSYLVNNLPICAVFASYLIRIIPSSSIQPKYFKLFLDSPLYWNQLYAKSMGTGQPNVNSTSLRSLIVPLPPLEEQKRIVAKIDQLMTLCDELEARQQKKQEKRILLNNAALDKLLTAPTSEEFAQHWQRICDNFNLLYDVPETVGQLRQAILQLAVQGKLVAQDEGDEPAAVLMEMIRAEKERLVKGKSKKLKYLPLIKSDEISFQLPNGWIIERLGHLIIDFQNGISKRKSDVGEPIPVLRLADIKNGQLVQDSLRKIKLTEKETNKYGLNNGDILIIRVNGSANLVGRFIPCLIDKKWAYSDHLIRMRILNQYILQSYLCIFANTTIARSHIFQKTITTAGQKTINQVGLSLLPIFIPPFEEQKRIVAKVDQLMAFCDELEAGLVQAQADGGELMEAVVHHVLAE